MKTKRILVAVDDSVANADIRFFLSDQKGWEILSETKAVDRVLYDVRTLHPDVVILDIASPSFGGSGTAVAIRRESPRVKIIGLATDTSKDAVIGAMKAGIHGYILRHECSQEIAVAVHTVCSGWIIVDGRLAESIAGVVSTASFVTAHNSRSRLSSRQLQIIRLVSAGKRTRAIAETLRIATRTVSTHRANIMRKLNVHNVAQLMNFAIRHELLEIRPQHSTYISDETVIGDGGAVVAAASVVTRDVPPNTLVGGKSGETDSFDQRLRDAVDQKK